MITETDLNKLTLAQHSLKLCHAIESAGASPQLTQCTIIASHLLRRIESTPPTANDRKEGNSELFRRYEACLTALAHCKHAMTREAWQEGPTETEAVQEANELLNEREQDREMESIQATESPTHSVSSSDEVGCFENKSDTTAESWAKKQQAQTSGERVVQMLRDDGFRFWTPGSDRIVSNPDSTLTKPTPSVSSSTREAGGRLVRETWIAWAKEQPNPKPSWLVSWEELSEPDKEVDRRIWEACQHSPASSASVEEIAREAAKAMKFANAELHNCFCDECENHRTEIIGKFITAARAPLQVELEQAKQQAFGFESAKETLLRLNTDLQSRLAKGAVTTPDISTHKRQFDLVRYMRSELHQAGLITDLEFTWLLTEADEGKIGEGSISRQRLDDYDQLREQLTAAETALTCIKTGEYPPEVTEHANDYDWARKCAENYFEAKDAQ